MKNGIGIAVLCWMLVFGSVVKSSAETNVVMVATFALSGVKQSGDTVASVRITNKDILNALNDTGQFSFGSKAQIVLISVNDQLPSFAVREHNGSDVVTTDIGDFFVLVESTELHTSNNLTSYVIQDFEFDNQNGTSFSVSGLSTLKRG